MKQKCTGHWESTKSILLWLVGAWNCARSVWALGVIQTITLQLLFLACLHGIWLYLCSLVFRKVFKRTPCWSAALSICGFIAADLCPSHSSCISFQSSHLCLLTSAKSPALLGNPFCDSGQKMDPGRKPGCSFISHVPFLSLQQHSVVLNAVVSYLFPSFLAVYDVREGGYHWCFQCGHWLKHSQVVWKQCV